MNRKYITILLPVLLAAVVSVAQQPAPQLEPSIERLQQHIPYLASDALDGRRTGTQGANDAAHYIAGEFSRLGLRPAMQKAGASRRLSVAMSQYLQAFPYVAGITLGQGNFMSLGDRTVNIGQDWMPLGFSSNASIERTSIAFVGYGISASELNYDDYADKRTSGKIALALAGTPEPKRS